MVFAPQAPAPFNHEKQDKSHPSDFLQDTRAVLNAVTETERLRDRPSLEQPKET